MVRAPYSLMKCPLTLLAQASPWFLDSASRPYDADSETPDNEDTCKYVILKLDTWEVPKEITKWGSCGYISTIKQCVQCHHVSEHSCFVASTPPINSPSAVSDEVSLSYHAYISKPHQQEWCHNREHAYQAYYRWPSGKCMLSVEAFAQTISCVWVVVLILSYGITYYVTVTSSPGSLLSRIENYYNFQAKLESFTV